MPQNNSRKNNQSNNPPQINFDDFIMVDWSASSIPKTGKDSIWIHQAHTQKSHNIPTRSEALSFLHEAFGEALRAGRRLLCAFDLCLGFPRGSLPLLRQAIAERSRHPVQRNCPNPPNYPFNTAPFAEIELQSADGSLPHWKWLWYFLDAIVEDDIGGSPNRNNRFEVASYLNELWTGGQGPFWGCPVGREQDRFLGARARDRVSDARILERRLTEQNNSSLALWQLTYPGAVGGQTLLGIPYLKRLRFDCADLADAVRVWPFDPDWQNPASARILLAETYFSLVRTDTSVLPKDRGQVEAAVAYCEALQAKGELAGWFYNFANPEITEEEGWTLFQEW